MNRMTPFPPGPGRGHNNRPVFPPPHVIQTRQPAPKQVAPSPILTPFMAARSPRCGKWGFMCFAHPKTFGTYGAENVLAGLRYVDKVIGRDTGAETFIDPANRKWTIYYTRSVKPQYASNREANEIVAAFVPHGTVVDRSQMTLILVAAAQSLERYVLARGAWHDHRIDQMPWPLEKIEASMLLDAVR